MCLSLAERNSGDIAALTPTRHSPLRSVRSPEWYVPATTETGRGLVTRAKKASHKREAAERAGLPSACNSGEVTPAATRGITTRSRLLSLPCSMSLMDTARQARASSMAIART